MKKYIANFNEFLSESESITEAFDPKAYIKYFKDGVHLIAVYSEEDRMNDKQLQKMNPKTVAVYGGLKYVLSLGKKKTVEAANAIRRPGYPSFTVVYDANTGIFYHAGYGLDKVEEIPKTDKVPGFLKTTYKDLESDIKVAATGHINDYEAMGAEIKKVNEANDYMTINEFTGVFEEFFEFVDKNKEFMDNDTIKDLKKAMPMLSKAWENECDAHGVEYEDYKIKFK